MSPTLNAFDNTGDSRATVLVLAYDPGVIGPLTATGMTRARGTESVESNHVLCFTAQRVGELPRIYEDITPSLLSRMGTGGNNTPMIAFSHTQGLDPQPSEIATPTLRVGGAGMAIAFTTEQTPKYSQDVALTLTKGSPTGGGQPQSVAQSVAVNFDEFNFTGGEEIHHAIRSGTRQSTGIVAETIVRRLTPTECERLMGWPDNHTLHRADGKTNSDSTRYKMCGNGVATPVAQWIADQLKELL